ncbi:MAG: branched-chain amino acid transaminase [Firmicutes bacterium]|nr:branched-chain amino acid transaminase [Bacillota bacterium]
MARYAYFEKDFVPLEDAKINVMTHAFLYGTACFEGIRAYWSEEEEQLFVFRMKEHYERIIQSCKILRIDPKYSVDELCEITLELLRRNGDRQDVYIRPVFYKSTHAIGVKLDGLDDGFLVFAIPFGDYLDMDRGLKARVSSWRHLEDNMIPMRAKINGAYVNAALAKDEALQDGYDEAIFLASDGHVSEGSAENLFIVRNGKLITTTVTADILEGITRNTVMQIALEELDIPVVERPIDRTELYVADEAFFVGTGAQVCPIAEIDHRPIGDGSIGPISRQIQNYYFDVVLGKVDKYRTWCAEVYV